MRCARCGSEQPDGAAYCANCGERLTAPSAAPPDQEASLETCEIVGQRVRQGLYGNRYRFAAEALGPTGRYVAAASAKDFSLMDGAMIRKEDATDLEDPATRGGKALEALDDLIAHLIREGWEPVETRGPYWYSHRFRRRARPLLASSGTARYGQATTPVAPAQMPLTRQKSVKVAYVLWLFLGLLGGHRYYLGKWGTAVLQTITVGGLGLWWLVDAFMVRDMVRQANGTS